MGVRGSEGACFCGQVPVGVGVGVRARRGRRCVPVGEAEHKGRPAWRLVDPIGPGAAPAGALWSRHPARRAHQRHAAPLLSRLSRTGTAVVRCGERDILGALPVQWAVMTAMGIGGVEARVPCPVSAGVCYAVGGGQHRPPRNDSPRRADHFEACAIGETFFPKHFCPATSPPRFQADLFVKTCLRSRDPIFQTPPPFWGGSNPCPPDPNRVIPLQVSGA